MRIASRIRMGVAVAVLAAIESGASMVVAAGPEEGQKLYLRYCSACHGAAGKGDGVVSQSMRPHPSDLTQLAKSSGGTFNRADVAGRIDGRETSRAHGDPDMPVWGEVLRTPGEGEASATSKVVLITDYLQSIQQK